MSEVNQDEVKHVAGLARLSLNQQEVEMYQKDLGSILTHIDELQKVNTDDVPEFLSPMRESAAFYRNSKIDRVDEIKQSLEVKEVLQNAPDAAYDQFRLDAVIEADE